MGSLLYAERLTFTVTKALLTLLKQGAVKSIDHLVDEVSEALADSQQDQLRKKGGSREIRRILSRIKYRGYIEGDVSGFSITDEGAQQLEKYLQRIEPLQPSKATPWDGKWRIILYDIPEDRSGARKALRLTLKQLGFIQLQKSVWIHPLPCLEHLVEIQKRYKVSEHISLVETSYFDRHKEFQKKFKEII